MTTELATQSDNPFSAYARGTNQRTIVGDILKFSRFGDWTAGQNDEEIEDGTQFVALMDELMHGWVKWEDGRPAAHEMGRLADGYRPPKRADLGDLDENVWERDKKTNVPRDPWQLTNYLPLKAVDSDRMFTFAPSSRGGLSAVGLLCEAYGKAIRAKPDQFPVVEVDSTSYKHAKYGKVPVPVMRVVGWTPKAEAMAALDASADQAADDSASDAPF